MNLCPAPSLLESLKSLGLENTEAGVTQGYRCFCSSAYSSSEENVFVTYGVIITHFGFVCLSYVNIIVVSQSPLRSDKNTF